MAQNINRKTAVVGAKQTLLRPRPGLSYNLIYETKLGSYNE
jgi:hypothetical protein